MKTAASHIARFPNCRTQTLTYLIEQEKMNDRLRKEVAARKRRAFFARFLSIFAGRRQAGG